MIAIGLFDCIQLCVHLCSAVVEVIYLCGVYDAVTIKSSIPIKVLFQSFIQLQTLIENSQKYDICCINITPNIANRILLSTVISGRTTLRSIQGREAASKDRHAVVFIIIEVTQTKQRLTEKNRSL